VQVLTEHFLERKRAGRQAWRVFPAAEGGVLWAFRSALCGCDSEALNQLIRQSCPDTGLPGRNAIAKGEGQESAELVQGRYGIEAYLRELAERYIEHAQDAR
jgi:hypothetical protein